MSIPFATDVDALAVRIGLRSNRTTSSAALPERNHPMSPIAAYYVMVATDQERTTRAPRHESVVVARTSRLERIVATLEALVRLGRPAVTQPI
jgi:hypothetical protein